MENNIHASVSLTKEQRHEVYKLALKVYESEAPDVGLCFCFSNACFRLCHEHEGYNEEFLISQFPELLKHKPVNEDECYWFPRSEIEPRITILTQCIEETKPDNHSQETN